MRKMVFTNLTTHCRDRIKKQDNYSIILLYKDGYAYCLSDRIQLMICLACAGFRSG